MEPWVVDAGSYIINDETEAYTYKSLKIKQYLNVGDHERKFILSGTKGLGKTLLLNIKSYNYYKHHLHLHKVHNLSVNNLTENITLSNLNLSKEELVRQFNNVDIWVEIWEFILMYCSVKIMLGDEGLSKELYQFFEKNQSVNSVLQRVLNDRKKSIPLITRYRSEIDSAFRGIKSGIVIFLDNLDQEVGKILRSIRYDDDEYKANLIRVYVGVQVGLIKAIYSINRANPHVKFYATIRQEAFLAAGDLTANFREYVIELTYSKENIQEIFERNIEAMPAEELVSPESSSKIENFLGFELMTHPFAKDANGFLRAEKAFDFIFRHSLGRPRDMIYIGRELRELIQNEYQPLSKEDKIYQVRLRVNTLSYSIFQDFRSEIIPPANDTEINGLIEIFYKNVLESKSLDVTKLGVIKRFYNLGLIGYVKAYEAYGQFKYKQYFKPVGNYNPFTMEELPKAEFYISHPCLDKALIDKHGFTNFYNENNIIGNGLDFHLTTTNHNISNDIYKRNLEHYHPKIETERWSQKKPGNNHDRELKYYYDTFFGNNDLYIQFKFEHIVLEEGKKIYFILKKLYLLTEIDKKDFPQYANIAAKYKDQLYQYSINRGYKSKLDFEGEPNWENFVNINLGRLLTVGCYLFLDFSCKQIHDFLVNGNLPNNLSALGTYKKGDSDIRYLRTCFFIKGLVNDSNKQAKYITKKNISQNLSDFEKETLKLWNDTFIYEIQEEDFPELNRVKEKLSLEWKKY